MRRGFVFYFRIEMKTIKELYKHFTSSAGICTDTRKILPGTIFFALKGENFNGNNFVVTSLSQGAAFAVADEKLNTADKRILYVSNVLETLQQLANYHRNHFNIPVLAITGSNGKTTSKELIASVLSKKYNTLFTKGNLNNHIGVPLTLLSLTKANEIAVIEMGANHQGEIAQLCEIANPTHGIITNVGKAHLDGFGGFEGVVKGKTEMYKFLKEHDGTVFYNYNNHILAPLVSDIKKKISYGSNTAADYSGQIESEKPYLSVQFNSFILKSNLTGAYNFENIMAAVAAGSYFKVSLKQIAEAIESYTPSNHRSQVIVKGSNTIILDAYNANPTSMNAAIENFVKNYSGKKIIVLGDMYELGSSSQEEHKNVIEKLKTCGLEKIMLVGNEFEKADTGKAGLHFKTSSDALAYLRKHPVKHSVILIKGSRMSAMEKVMEAFETT